MPSLRLALAQLNPLVGDLQGNADLILDSARRAHVAGADLMATGQMALSGYPVEDLALNPGFLRATHGAVAALATKLHDEGLGGLAVIVGHPDGPVPPRLLDATASPMAISRNCASVLHGGRVIAWTAKHHLPSTSVFDERRTFIPGDELLILRLQGTDIAVAIGEDVWWEGGPVARVLEADASVLIALNASPYERDRDEQRLPLLRRRAIQTDSIVAAVELVGAQDDLVFDGDSVVVNQAGEVVARAPRFQEHLLLVDVTVPATSHPEVPAGARRVHLAAREVVKPKLASSIAEQPDERQQVWEALVLGLRDYVEKNRFPSVVLGLSGGIDSALCAAIAVDAIGADRVFGISMPSQWSSDHSRTDADDLAERLGIHYSVEPIADLVAPVEAQLGLTGVAAENVQARMRAIILMGASNMHGHLLLATGNKTEGAVGYSTMYGDTAGGFAPITDVPKTLVWELARWRNESAILSGQTAPIPENSITKPPSAELRAGQTDQDSLPPYEVLDAILEAYITRRLGRSKLIALGFAAEVIDRVVELVDRAEWKRRQEPLGPRISSMAFGRDRQVPITMRPRA